MNRCPRMKPATATPRPTLTVACLHQFVVRHVKQITQLRLLQLLYKPADEILIDVADTQLLDEMRQSTRGAQRDPLQTLGFGDRVPHRPLLAATIDS